MDRLIEFFALFNKFGKARLRDFERPLKLGQLLVAHVVKIQQLTDLLKAEAKTLAAQDELQAGAIAACEKAFLPFPHWKQQLLCFVKSQGARRYFKGITHLPDGHDFVGHLIGSLFHLYASADNNLRLCYNRSDALRKFDVASLCGIVNASLPRRLLFYELRFYLGEPDAMKPQSIDVLAASGGLATAVPSIAGAVWFF